VVSAYDERLIRDAIQHELNRQGQVFFLHNRVSTIDAMALKLRALVPHARLVVGHGQMDPDELEEVMTRFVNGEADVLLSTTIVESGLDIPNANTIIIDRADRFGLSELYQLRGRVGRYKHQAHAYLLIPRHAQLLSEARKRITAIRQYSSLGSGFKIAMRDLEIRGAGNLLGSQQSGHITAVGFDLYCQLLKQSVAALKGEKVKPRVDVDVRLDFLPLHPADEARTTRTPRTSNASTADVPAPPTSTPRRSGPSAGLPTAYVPDPKQRLELHRRFAQISEPSDLRRLRDDLRDRYGPPPPPVELLFQVAELRLFAAALDISAIDVRDDQLRLTRNGQFIQVGGKFPRLTKRDPKARLQEMRRFIATLGVSLLPPGRKSGNP
jgi:transcription-repair coupling factor (superfamily II helicase)